jgi:hypothetical protein
MLIKNPKGFLTKELGSDGFVLRACFVSNALVESVDAQVLTYADVC